MPNSDFSALAVQVQKRMDSMILDHQEDVLKVARAMLDKEDTVKVIAIEGGNNYTAVSGVNKPGNTAFKTLSATSNPERFEVNAKLTQDDLDKLGDRAADYIAALLIVNAYAKLGVDFFAFIAGAAAVAHPLSGAGVGLAATGGGTAYVADEHTLTTINAGDTILIKNIFTLTLTPTNLRTVLNERSDFSDLDGHRGAPKSKKYLFCVGDLQGIARQMCQQQGQIFNGSGLVEGFKGEFEGDEPIVLPREASASTDLWGVIHVTEMLDADGNVIESSGPVLIHLQTTPGTTVLPEPGGGFINCYGQFKYDIFAHPNCHRDLQLSDPS